MTKNRTPTPVYLDPGMHSGLEVKGLNEMCRSLPESKPNLFRLLDHLQNILEPF